jgi:hypothetical protein
MPLKSVTGPGAGCFAAQEEVRDVIYRYAHGIINNAVAGARQEFQ